LRGEEKGGESCDLLADRVPTTADPPTPTTDPDPYAAVERLVLGRRHPGRPGPHGSPCLGAVGTISALDEVDSFERTTVPGAVTVPVTDPGTMVVYCENPAELARYATTPTWQQLRLTVTGPTDPPPATTSIRDGSAGRWRSSKPQPPAVPGVDGSSHRARRDAGGG
jgi:hypothetical protein